jgi:hypothetical protein
MYHRLAMTLQMRQWSQKKEKNGKEKSRQQFGAGTSIELLFSYSFRKPYWTFL